MEKGNSSLSMEKSKLHFKETDKKCLFVMSIPYDFDHNSLERLFAKYGEIEKIDYFKKKQYISPYVKIFYKNEDDAVKAINELNQTFFNDRKMKIRFAKLTDPKEHMRKHETRKRLTAEDSHDIYDCYINKNIEEAKELAFACGYKERTYYKCIEQEGQISEAYKHPKHKRLWTDEQIDECIELFEENCTLTIEEALEKCINEKGFHQIVLSTLESYLLMKLITYKEVSYEAANRNSTSTKKKRIEYLTELLTYSNADKIYIDEVGYSIATKREKGWSRKGRKAIGKIPVLKTPHVSVCVAICQNHGILDSKSVNGSFNGDEFRDFISHLIQVVQQCTEIHNPIFIFDNCKIHYAAHIENLCKSAGIKVKFLPPYSPNLNPIENVFGIIKKRFKKKKIAVQYRQALLDTNKLKRGLRMQTRNQILQLAFNQSLGEMKSTEINSCYDHLGKYIINAMKNEDI